MGTVLSAMAFKGMFPASDDGLLDASNASYAADVDLYGGVIRPVRKDIRFGGTVYNFDPAGVSGTPYLFSIPVSGAGDIVISSRIYDHAAAVTSITGDTLIYLAGPSGAQSKMVRRKRSGGAILVSSTNIYGTQKPTAPVVTVQRADPEAAVTRYTVMALSYVYPDGTEGALSLNSGEISYVPGDGYTVAAIPLDGVSPVPSSLNLYVSVGTTDGNPVMTLLANIEQPAFAFSGTLPNDVLGDSYPDFDPLPANLRCVAAAPWGGLALTTPSEPGVVQFTDSTYHNRVYREHDLNVGATVKCLLRGATCIFVLCDDGGPFVITGTALGNHIITGGTRPETLVATARGAAAYNDVCVFAGAHGLLTLSSAGLVSPMTEEDVFNREQWTGMNPATCAVAFLSDGSVVFSMPDAGRTGVLKPYGLVWRTGAARRALATLHSDDSVVYV